MRVDCADPAAVIDKVRFSIQSAAVSMPSAQRRGVSDGHQSDVDAMEDVIDIVSPPFQLTRKGSTEVNVHVQVHFVDSAIPRLDVVHKLTLVRQHRGCFPLPESLCTALQRNELSVDPILGSETAYPVTIPVNRAGVPVAGAHASSLHVKTRHHAHFHGSHARVRWDTDAGVCACLCPCECMRSTITVHSLAWFGC